VEEEADECFAGWSWTMELIVEVKLVDVANLRSIMSETNEILAMMLLSIKTCLAKTQCRS